MIERRHARQPDPVRHLPIGLARLVVAHSHHTPRRMLLPQRRWRRIHIRRKGHIVPRSPMAPCALRLVDLRPALVHILADPERRCLHLAVNPRIQRHLHNLLLERKRLVRGRHRGRAPAQIRRHAARHHHHRQHHPQQYLAEPAARIPALCHVSPLVLGKTPPVPADPRPSNPRWMF